MRLQEAYKKQIVPKLKEKFGHKSNMAVPRVAKAVINVGFGRQNKEKDFIDNVASSLARISGQKPIFTIAKKAIASFKTRKGMVIGAAVTLRGKRMYDFIDKLINISFPRVRDFRGISDKQVDANGNLTIGFRENASFPEISADELEKAHGLEICLPTTSKNREEGLELFKLMGFPFKKD